MQKPVRIHPAALRDADAAVAWYAGRSDRAAVWFVDELEHLLDLIAESPGLHPVFDAGTRRAFFRRFPYYLVFRADQDGIVVLAVAHAKRRPGFWLDRA